MTVDRIIEKLIIRGTATGDAQMFFTATDARAFIANHAEAAFELMGFTNSDNVEIERDGHCGFVADGKAFFLCDSDLIAFANHLKAL